MNRSITLLLLVMLPLLACCSASATNKASDSDSTAVESQAQEEPQGMLKAFGLKGKVKTLTLKVDADEAYSYSFDINGNYIQDRNYNGGHVEMECNIDTRDYCTISIDDWKWTKIMFTGLMKSFSTYEMTKYDNQNRPTETTVYIEAEENHVKRNIPISYVGSDSHGNYTSIIFHTDGMNKDDYNPAAGGLVILKKVNVELEYWPDNVSGAEVPTELTESMAINLIKKANRKEANAVSRNLQRFLDMQATIPFVTIDFTEFGGDGHEYFTEGLYADQTILSDMEDTHIPDIEVRIDDIILSADGDCATVLFHYSTIYEGKYHEEDFADQDHYALVYCKFENGKWVVDDCGWDIGWARGVSYAQSTYTEYWSLDEKLDAIKSGALEREIRQKFSRDPKMNQYLKKVSDFKTKFNIK